MTRKDFELIAEAIKAARVTRLGPRAANYAAYHALGINDVAFNLADALGRTNPRFNRARFLEACGIEMEETGDEHDGSH